jgi:hypothetical protein
MRAITKTAPTVRRNGCTKSRWKLNKNSWEGTKITHSLRRWSPERSGDRFTFFGQSFAPAARPHYRERFRGYRRSQIPVAQPCRAVPSLPAGFNYAGIAVLDWIRRLGRSHLPAKAGR